MSGNSGIPRKLGEDVNVGCVRAVLAAHCWICDRYAQCRCPDCEAVRTAIREALAATDRGETADLGSFARYADEDTVEYAQIVGGRLVKIAAREA